MSDLRRQIGDLSPEERTLLLHRLSGIGRAARPRIRPRPRPSDPGSLSFAQERLWFLDQLDPGDPAYNIVGAVRINGPLHVGALDRSLRAVVQRHEVLRTTFPTIDGRPVQRVAPEGRVSLQILGVDTEAEALAAAAAEARHRFDLAHGPLLRVLVCPVASQVHILILNVHHIVADAWSLAILLRELTALHAAFSTGTPAPLTELAVQYSDYAAWQRETLTEEKLSEELGYWAGRLGDLPGALRLPVDQVDLDRDDRPGGETLFFTLHQELKERLRDLGIQHSCTPFMTLLAAFAGLIFRYTDEPDLIIGTPIANRSLPEVQDLIGPFINTIGLRLSLSRHQTFAELLDHVRSVVMEAFAHQEVPFERVVEAVKPSRDSVHNPIFQVLFQVHSLVSAPARSSDLCIEQLDIERNIARADLGMSLAETASDIVGQFEYNARLYDRSMMGALVSNFASILDSYVAEPDQSIVRSMAMTPAAIMRVLGEWAVECRSAPTSCGVHELFQLAVAAAPEAVAICDDDRFITFQEMDRRSNQLARHLVRLGVGPDIPVGVCVADPVDAIMSILGILKAGGCYVFIDSTSPLERKTFIREDTNLRTLIVDGASGEWVTSPDVRVVAVEDAAIAAEDDQAPPSRSTEASLAYIIYTSGSTGTPKGVLIGHDGVVNLIEDQIRLLAVTPRDHILQFFSFSFDASVWEMMMALASGAMLHLASREVLGDAIQLHQLLQRRAITIATLPASLLALLPAHDLAALHTVISAAEPCTASTVARWAPGRHFLNGYGPTETTIATTIDSCAVNERPVIGRPFVNVAVYVLDDWLQPAPVGVPQELHIGGPGVSHGYLRRPGLTAERFIPDPFSEVPGKRLYKTGDLVRYLADGRLDLLGRMDQQVKIRGYRIELGEIEAVLSGHPGVQASVVVVREDVPGDRRVVAYLVPAAGVSLAREEVRAYLKRQLPAYMLPTAVVQLETLPLNSSGKVDRRALPEPNEVREGARTTLRDRVELELVAIWADVLGRRDIEVTDDFFDLGGHSLLAMDLMMRIRAHFGCDLPLSALFESPTIRELAHGIRESADLADCSPLVPISVRPGVRPFCCVHGMGGDILALIHLGRALAADYGFCAFEAIGVDGKREPQSRIEDMARTYIGALRAMQPDGPYYLVGYSYGGIIAFEMAHQLCRAGSRVALLALLDTIAPHLSTVGPLHEALQSILTSSAGVGRDMALHDADFALRQSSGQFDRIAEMLGVPDRLLREIDPERLRALARVVYAQFRALTRYTPPPYGRTITLLRSATGRDRGATDAWGMPDDPTLGWARLAPGRVVVHDVPGTHRSMLDAPQVGALAGVLRACHAAGERG